MNKGTTTKSFTTGSNHTENLYGKTKLRKKCTILLSCGTLYVALIGTILFKGEIYIMKLGIVMIPNVGKLL